jgi:hypothetical protein
MELSIFLAKVIGLYSVIIAVGLLVRPKQVDEFMVFLKHSPAMYLSGFLALIIGVLLVVSHNVWPNDWRVIITIFGWLSLIKGIVLLFFPTTSIRTVDTLVRGKILTSFIIAYLILGLYLSYVGFMAY